MLLQDTLTIHKEALLSVHNMTRYRLIIIPHERFVYVVDCMHFSISMNELHTYIVRVKNITNIGNRNSDSEVKSSGCMYGNRCGDTAIVKLQQHMR